MIKGSTHQEDVTIVNIYVPQIGASKYIKQTITELKRKNKQQYNNSWGL